MHTSRRGNLWFFEIFVLLYLFIPAWTEAATVTKVQGKALLIDLEDTKAQPGDQFFAVTSEGKKKAIIEISKAKGGKAIGKILKGAAESGQTLQKKSSGGGGDSEEGASTKTTASGGGKRKKFSIGIMGGYSMNTMSVKLVEPVSKTQSEVVSMSGSGFAAQLLMDLDLFSIVSARALIGMDKFSATATAKNAWCGGSTSCKADITYIAADFWARLLVMNSKTRIWLGGGGGILMPSSNSTTALDSSSIGTTATFLGGGGIDLGMGKMSLPIQVEYAMFPASEDVKANAIRIKLGLIF